jgi:WD40 repeat protein
MNINFNENIFKTIISSLILYKLKQICDIIKNKTIAKLLLTKLTNNNIMQSLGKTKTIIKAHNKPIYYLNMLRDGNIVTASYDGTIKVWDTNNSCIKTIIADYDYHYYVISAHIDPNGNFITCFSNDEIKVREKGSFHCINNIYTDDMRIYCTLVLPDDNLLCAVYSEPKSFLVFDYKKNYECLFTFDSGFTITSLVNLSNNRFAFAMTNGQINIWDVISYDCLSEFEAGHNDMMNGLFFNPWDEILLSASSDVIKLWDINTCQCIKAVKNGSRFYCLLLLPGRYLAVSMVMGVKVIKILDMKNFEIVNGLEARKCFMLLPDKRAAAAEGPGNIIIWSY